MISLFLIIILLLILIYSIELFQTAKYIKVFSFLLGLAVFYIALYNVTYNSDWDAYEAMFNGFTVSNDYLFNFISDFFNDRGHEYDSVYKFHIFLMSAGFLFFVSRFSNHNIFLVFLIYLIFQIIPISNQIRYFVAFAFFLVSIYQLIVVKDKVLFLVFCILSLFSHFAILLMYPFGFIFYFVRNDKLLKLLLYISFGFAILMLIISRIGLIYFSHFSAYFETEYISSISGGVFNNLILVFWLFFLIKRNNFLVSKYSSLIADDLRYQLLYKLSLYTIIFIPSGIFIQILSHRYVEASFIIWILYLLYTLGFEENYKSRLTQLSRFLILSIFTFMYKYLLPKYVLNYSEIELVIELFESNTLFN